MNNQNRIFLVDHLRGVAVIGMVIYHFLFILDWFDIYSLNLGSNYFQVPADFIRILFLSIAGISLMLRYMYKSQNFYYSFMRRNLEIILGAGIISVVTFLYDKNTFVLFGVLHLISTSLVVVSLLIKYPRILIFLGVSILMFGYLFLPSMIEGNIFLYILGVDPGYHTALDYFPIFPWSGYVLIGSGTGYFFDEYKQKVKKSPSWIRLRSTILEFLGNYSLLIYLIHVPILVCISLVIAYLFGL